MKIRSIISIVATFLLLVIYSTIYKIYIFIDGSDSLSGHIVPLGGMIAVILISLLLLSIRSAIPSRFKVIRIILLILVPFCIFCGIMNWLTTT